MKDWLKRTAYEVGEFCIHFIIGFALVATVVYTVKWLMGIPLN